MKKKPLKYTKPNGAVYVLCLVCGNHHLQKSPCFVCEYNWKQRQEINRGKK